MALTPEIIEGETKSERIGMAVTPTEMRALEFVQLIHGDKYDGAATVLRDYSIKDAVELYRRSKRSA
jgi:hypothetical protein